MKLLLLALLGIELKLLLLLLGAELKLLLLLSKLLTRGKLLLLLGEALLLLLLSDTRLLLLEGLEVLVETRLVELAAQWRIRVEVGGVEDGPPWCRPRVGEGLALDGGAVLGLDLLLLGDHTRYQGNTVKPIQRGVDKKTDRRRSS